MRKFKLLAIALFMVAAIGAFASAEQSNAPTYSWVGFVKLDNWYCSYYDLDWAWYCDSGAFGPLCTVQGKEAYETLTGCENEYEFDILYRVY